MLLASENFKQKEKLVDGNRKAPVIHSDDSPVLPHATIREAIQKRIRPSDHSSIIPGIDINELKRSLDLLKYALDYSEAIIETIKIPLIVLDKHLQVLTANRSFYDTFKIKIEKTEGKLIYQLNDSAWNIPKLRVLLEKLLPNNDFFEDYEVELTFPHIGHKVMLLSARRTYRQVNGTEAILLAFQDITDRKAMERQKDDFIGIVSHELKTPLTSIKAFSQLLEKHHKENKDEKGTFLLSKMTDQMERLTQLMASFVNVYKIKNGQLELHKKRFKIKDLIELVISDFKYTTKSHSVINNAKDNIEVFADKERISQVLINLISNSVKYSPDADKIIISLSKDKKYLTVSIQDFGLGIPKEEQGRIFERFFRVKGKREKNIEGLGLGLFISNEIIDQHNGKLWVESDGKSGSTFYFTLPIKKN